METHKFSLETIKMLSFRELASLLKLLTSQNRKQMKYLIQNSHLKLTCNEEYMIEEDIYNATEHKIQKIKFRMRNMIRKSNTPKNTKEF